MHAFDYLFTLFSFVYALSIAHLLATVGDLIVAARRVVFSWVLAGWMLASLLAPIAWWIGLWELRAQKAWPMPTVGLFFLLAGLLYLQTRLICPRIPAEGPIDMRAYHRAEGWKYLAAYAVLGVLTLAVNTAFGQTAGLGDWLDKSRAVLPLTLAAVAAAIFKQRAVQACAVIVELAAWAWYFTSLQSTLTG